MPSEETLKKTPLHALHTALGARMAAFAGWDMPIQYSGVVDEHMAVRTKAGLFDVSHMGEIEVRGVEALAFLQRTTSNDVSRLADGQAHYSGITNRDGGFVDDVLVHRLGPQEFLLCVNAANAGKDARWLQSQANDEVAVADRSGDWAQVALQGPAAVAILTGALGAEHAALKRYRFRRADLFGAPAIVARTGYTGEDGFEIYIAPQGAPALWERLLAAGRPHGLMPAGLGARDTLRLEAKLALYGQDIDATTTPLEAGLDWIVSWDKGDFMGRAALAAQREKGVTRRLAGFEMTGRGIARHGYPIRVAGADAGEVASGSYAPFLKKNIGLAYLPAGHDQPGAEFEVIIRDAAVAARVVPTPFYRRTP